VVRGPHPERPDRWYWRAVRYGDGTEAVVWTGWATRDEVVATLRALPTDAPHRSRGERAALDTVEHLVRAWFAACEDGTTRAKPLRPATLATYRQHAKRIAHGLGDVRVRALDGAAVARYVAERRRAGAASGTLALDIAVLRMAWTWARTLGEVPAREVAWPRFDTRERVRTRYTPKASEVAAVLDHLPGWAGDVVRVLWGTGARVGELADLRVASVDLDGGWLAVDGKTGARRIPLDPETLDVLRPYVDGRAPEARLWPVSREVARRLPGRLGVACVAAGVPLWTSHALRRSAVDRLARSGVDVATAAALLGHSPAVMLTAYRQVSADDLSGAMARARLGALSPARVLRFTRPGGDPDR
jgi:integrase/recombinase XerC